ncbi:MAG: hypothetical protein IJK98_00365 [Clostridia bacterium]|nr:hypothetical protein [Clostridia bacterium]
MKRLLPAVLLLAAVLLLVSCGNQRPAAACPLTVNGTPLDEEVFTYFLDKAAAALPEGSQEEQIGYAVQLCIHYVAVNSTFAGEGMTLSPAEKKETDEDVNTQWRLYGPYYSSLGVSRQTFAKIRRSDRYTEKLRQAYFGEGGSDEVPAQRLREYLAARYVAFRAIRLPKTVRDAYGKEAERSEAQNSALQAKISAGLSAVNDNGTGIESVFATFVSDRNGDREEYAEVVTDGSDHAWSAEFVEAVRGVPEGTAAALDYGDSYYLVYRENILADDDIYEAYKGKCLEALTENDLLARIDAIGGAYSSVKDQPALAACWNSYRNALAKAEKQEKGN